LLCVIWGVLGTALAFQVKPVDAVQPSATTKSPTKISPGTAILGASEPTSYLLGPRDQVSLASPEADEISKTFRIDDSGDINLPLVGRVHAAGVTTNQLEEDLTNKLKRFFRSPTVSVNIAEFGSEPVSVIGSVGSPGVHQLRGQRTLIEVLSMAGGLRSDAGGQIRITRPMRNGRLPLKHVEEDPNGSFSSAVVSAPELLSSLDPQDNLTIFPGDVISVSAAPMVYVLGDVTHSGGFLVSEGQAISALRAVSLAGGMLRSASSGNARIFRNRTDGGERQEISINLSRVQKGKERDVILAPQDILYVPSSTAKRITARAAEAAVQTISGVAIFSAAR